MKFVAYRGAERKKKMGVEKEGRKRRRGRKGRRLGGVKSKEGVVRGKKGFARKEIERRDRRFESLGAFGFMWEEV